MNLKLNENIKAIFTSEGKDYVIVNAKINGNYIVATSEDGKLFATINNEENIKILKETNTEDFI